jgi:phosphopantetheinyl transferase (holo-ACP synthase)
MWSEEALDALLSERLQSPVRTAIAEAPVTPAELTAGERECFAGLATPRAVSWLRGRAALRRLLASLGADTDTAGITFPCVRFSLSHSAGLALAIHVEGVDGVGVDLEARRLSVPRARRWCHAAGFFATEAEQRWLEDTSDDLEAALLRLWTIKEAVFKADRNNAARGLGDYALEDPGTRDGAAVLVCDRRLRFRYAALGEPGAMLAAAVRRGGAS